MFGNTVVRNSLATLAIVAGMFGCSQQVAPTPAANETPQSATKTSTAPSDNAVRAYIDPKTGQLREPTPEEIAALAAAEAEQKKASAATQSKPSEPREVTLPNGAVAIQLDESAQQPLRACIQPNGEAKMDHDCDAADKGTKR
jgi:hypothetical protein